MDASGQEGLKDIAASYAMIEPSRLERSVDIRSIETGRIPSFEEVNGIMVCRV